MARGNEIIVTADPKGQFEEGLVKSGDTFKPGMIVQKDLSVDLVGGRHTFTIYNADADGGRPKGAFWVVTNLLQALIGGGVDVDITDRAQMYCPRAGEELNLLVLNIAGTGDDHAAGEMLIVDDTTGKLIATTGTPETEVAMLKETITDPVADTLAWCEWTGY
jgi:hypothetical protein